MNDPELDDLVRGLPPVTASPGFEARVARRLAEPYRPRTTRRALVAAGALAVLAAVVIVPVVRSRHEEHRRAELRAEVMALRQAVAELRAGVPPEPVYVGGDDRVDIVIDPRALAQAGKAVRPAAYRGEEL
jgi:hypothetical protein